MCNPFATGYTSLCDVINIFKYSHTGVLSVAKMKRRFFGEVFNNEAAPSRTVLYHGDDFIALCEASHLHRRRHHT